MSHIECHISSVSQSLLAKNARQLRVLVFELITHIDRDGSVVPTLMTTGNKYLLFILSSANGACRGLTSLYHDCYHNIEALRCDTGDVGAHSTRQFCARGIMCCDMLYFSM